MKYIIYAPVYDELVGGVIALYKLCRTLLELGFDAKIWPMDKPPFSQKLTQRKKISRYLKWYAITRWKLRKYHKRCGLPIARRGEVKNSVVIYPETVNGNPLRASNVVRWLLNKPGILSGSIDYGEDDLFFYYNKHFNDPEINPEQNNQLRVVELFSDIYKQYNFGDRSGSCYIIRKGQDRPHDQHDEAAIRLDGKSHHEVAKIFNECEYFISYDLYTMYSRYAAFCGCMSIVVPAPGLSKNEWRSEEELTYGIAYGFDDMEWARSTRGKLLEVLSRTESESRESVHKFAEFTQKYFS
jgi:hypothetical protein